MIVNDPVFGFIEIPEGLLTQLVKHPYVVRLTRLKQLGATHYVYPGAVHTRFQHSVGALHLVSQAVNALGERGVCILDHERMGVEAAMLLHDLGHGPMSHVLEHCFVKGISHEEISLHLMEHINREMGGALDIAIRIYRDSYPKHYLHELVCSQLDMDRLDYLCRDSFFTGVREGIIGVARIIKMLDVRNDQLVVEGKGIYTIENYLMARRLMYWQVYLHKTVLAAGEMLRLAIERARRLVAEGQEVECAPCLAYFLRHHVDAAFAKSHPEWISQFAALDDTDVESALKQWATHEDFVLSTLARGYTERRLLKATELEAPLTDEQLNTKRMEVAQKMGITPKEGSYFVQTREIGQMLYSTADDHISIIQKDGSVRDLSAFSELLTGQHSDRTTKRYFLFSPR